MPPLIPDSSYSTLSDITIKVRRLTRSPSIDQLSDLDIKNYINTFILYDFPSHIKLFSQRDVFTFYTQPYQDVYETTTVNINDIFYNFNNRYISLHPPFYSGGYLGNFFQDRQQFFGVYPKINSIQQIGTGDGVTTVFRGFIPGMPNQSAGVCLLQGSVLFDSIDINGFGISVVDQFNPSTPLVGSLVIPQSDLIPLPTIVGTINYTTGKYVFTFLSAPAVGATVNSQFVIQQASIPRALLFYDNKITLRPVPDQPYRLSIEAYIRPTILLNTSDVPEISQWWQYIAYGAAKKVFEDRMDMDSIAMIMPEFKKQELMALRTTIVQNTNERTSTIYTEQTNFGASGYGEWGGGLF